MEKLSLSLCDVTSKVMMVAEPALEVWSQSLNGAVSEELLEFFKQRIRSAVRRIGNGIVAEITQSDMSMTDDSVAPQILLLDRYEYGVMKGELARAFQEQMKHLDFDSNEEELAQYQVRLLINVLEDSIAASFMSALFNTAERLEREKSLIKRALSDVTETLERDRQRLAFDLHDGPAQALSSALLQADMLDDLVSSKEAHAELASLKLIISQCLHELRTSIYTLKPQSMFQEGLVAMIKGYTKQFSVRTGIDVEVIVKSIERTIPEVVEINTFRVVQEALGNVAKHARASRVIISISFSENSVSCRIEDNGAGFDKRNLAHQAKGVHGYGLISMRDRVGQFLGDFQVESRLGSGTHIKFSIPI